MRFKLVVSALFAMLLIVPSLVYADVSLSLFWDDDTRTSKLYLLGSDEAVIAELSWAVRLPAGYSQDYTIEYVPMRVLAHIRDQADQSSHSEASTAASWIRSKMGSWCDTPLNDIPGSILAPIDTGTTTHWCGKQTTGDGWCPNDCTATDDPYHCGGCGCAADKQFPD